MKETGRREGDRGDGTFDVTRGGTRIHPGRSTLCGGYMENKGDGVLNAFKKGKKRAIPVR